MKTLTITEGRGRLGHWLKRATQGEDIGFVVEGKSLDKFIWQQRLSP